jgi:C1A family cysteine protease
MGWIPDLPDPRDYTWRHDEVLPLLRRLKSARSKNLPDEIDLRSDGDGDYFTPVEDQGPLNSSTAFAVLNLVEYFERRIHGRTFEGSKLFLYKVARNLLRPRLHTTGDTGADLRTTLKVLTSIGVPPEEYWPYEVDRFDEEPSSFVYGLATPLSDLRYFRLDEPNQDGAATWATVRSFLAAGFPILLGFSVPSSLTTDANIPYRPDLDTIRGGMAALAVGYKLHHFARNQHALLIRSSWGSQWGDKGYGWLDAAIVLHQLAKGNWTLVNSQWLGWIELSTPSVA